MDNYELQLNMTNPQQHCDIGWENWCLEEGGHIEYTMTLGQQPEGAIQVYVSGEFLQTNETIVFTPDDFHQPHIVRLNFMENTRVSGNYWMNLVHTVSYVNSSHGDRWWKTREPAVGSSAGWTQPGEAWDHRINDAGIPFDNVTSWMPGRLLASEGRIFPLVIPVLIADNEVERSLHILMAIEYSTISDMEVFSTYFQTMLGTGLGVSPRRIIVDDVIVAGLMTRRLEESETPALGLMRGRRQLEGTENYAVVNFHFSDGEPTADETASAVLVQQLEAAHDSDTLSSYFDFDEAVRLGIALIRSAHSNVFYTRFWVGTHTRYSHGFAISAVISSAGSSPGPRPRGPFVLDRSFFDPDFARIFDADYPDAAFGIEGAGNGSYMFRPCFHTPAEFLGDPDTLCPAAVRNSVRHRVNGTSTEDCPVRRPPQPPGRTGWQYHWSSTHSQWSWWSDTQQTTVWERPPSSDCEDLCVWRDVQHFANSPPSIIVGHDDRCFQQYPPDATNEIELMAWVTSDLPTATRVTVTMQPSIDWHWQPSIYDDLAVHLLSQYGGDAVGYPAARSFVDTGPLVTSLDVRSYLALTRSPGLTAFDGRADMYSWSNHLADINDDWTFLVPPPPPVPWGADSWLRDLAPLFRRTDNLAAQNVSCSDAAFPCMNGGICDESPFNDLKFADDWACICPFEFMGPRCQHERFEEFNDTRSFRPELYNVTLRAETANGGSAVAFSELLVWDTNECLVANGGCGHPNAYLLRAMHLALN
jgi:hypothetical protein